MKDILDVLNAVEPGGRLELNWEEQQELKKEIERLRGERDWLLQWIKDEMLNDITVESQDKFIKSLETDRQQALEK